MSEPLPYDVERIIEDVEIRLYPPMVVVTVRGLPDNEAFGILFRYISGSNRARAGLQRSSSPAAKGETIPMAAPVISVRSEKIPMTAPVVSASDSFSFVMPAGYSWGSTPEPLDTRAIVEEVAGRRVAVKRFSGTADGKTVATRTRQLLDATERLELRPVGRPFLMRYNAPFTPGFLRRNEVGVELMTRDPDD